VETAHDPERLLEACKEVEAELGRETAAARHGPRTIDVDVLLLGHLVSSSRRLTLPHPEIRSRRFVLVPLLELDPELTLPDGAWAADALAALPAGQEVRRITGPLV
jgi:2-amino-4-hydroxy-6-hydroxymethyldihydropteridine diphosphokinase